MSPEGLTMAEDKIKTILDWPEPRKVKEVQSFLGFANFYRHFIYNYSDIVIPLTRTTRKGIPFRSSGSEGFQDTKESLHHSSGPHPLDSRSSYHRGNRRF